MNLHCLSLNSLKISKALRQKGITVNRKEACCKSYEKYEITFQTLLRTYGAVSSLSRKGNPYDNALMESFYRTIKRELIQDANFETPEQAQQEIFKYIELYYNTKRMHSKISPFFVSNLSGKGHGCLQPSINSSFIVLRRFSIALR